MTARSGRETATEVRYIMASVKQTREGNWYAVNEVTGDIIQGQPQGGFATAGGAKGWAVRNLKAVRSRSEVGTF
jgi:hypothetical protein